MTRKFLELGGGRRRFLLKKVWLTEPAVSHTHTVWLTVKTRLAGTAIGYLSQKLVKKKFSFFGQNIKNWFALRFGLGMITRKLSTSSVYLSILKWIWFKMWTPFISNFRPLKFVVRIAEWSKAPFIQSGSSAGSIPGNEKKLLSKLQIDKIILHRSPNRCQIHGWKPKKVEIFRFYSFVFAWGWQPNNTCKCAFTRVFAQNTRVFAQNTRVFAQNTRVFAQNTRVFAQNTRVIAKTHAFDACFLHVYFPRYTRVNVVLHVCFFCSVVNDCVFYLNK